MDFSGIQVWGDSVLKGVVFDPLRNRYALLKNSAVAILADRFKLPIQNHSRMGRTAPEGLKALREQPPESLKGQLVVLEFGGNDCDFDWAEVEKAPEAVHSPHTPAAVFAQTMEEMVSLVRRCGGTPLVCTLPPLDCRRYLHWITKDGLSEERILAYLGVPERIYRWQEYYSALVTKVAATLNCHWLPIREAFLACVRGEDVLCIDGIHPNAAGHQLIAEAALAYEPSRDLLHA